MSGVNISPSKFISEKSLRGMGAFNWIGVRTLMQRELMRFLKIYISVFIRLQF